ncbi:MAG: BON domain-containing protein [bacterium]
MALLVLMAAFGLALLPACSTVPIDPESAAASNSDRDIEADISDRLRQDSMTSRFPLSVVSEDGVVTLAGTIGSEAARMRAVSMARGAAGVKGVIDNLSE